LCHLVPVFGEYFLDAIRRSDIKAWLAEQGRKVPAKYSAHTVNGWLAIVLTLGIATGRRPSELRPLRRAGPTPDIVWGTGELLIRRSDTLGVVNDRTKTKRRLRIPLPKDLGRAAQVHDFVTRAISGHATTVMHEHYSSVAADEVREVVMPGPKTRPRCQPHRLVARND
jgi:hypothetical protein